MPLQCCDTINDNFAINLPLKIGEVTGQSIEILLSTRTVQQQ